jgi:hypothetical protein
MRPNREVKFTEPGIIVHLAAGPLANRAAMPPTSAYNLPYYINL